jgi:diguanylate cyclase (GGDEF)-like protein
MFQPMKIAESDFEGSAVAPAALAGPRGLFAGYPVALILGSTIIAGLYWNDYAGPKLILAWLGVVAFLSVGVIVKLAGTAALQVRAAARLQAQADAARLIVEEYEQRASGWVWQTDAGNRVVYVSPMLPALLGRTSRQFVGQTLPGLLGGSGALGTALISQKPFCKLEIELSAGSNSRWVSLSGEPILQEGVFHGFRGVASDVTEMRFATDKLASISSLDPVTGLPHRGSVRQLLGETLAEAGDHQPCAMIFLELHGFKTINDRYGQLEGDAALKAIAARLVKEAGSAGRVGRMGGDEFAIVVPKAEDHRRLEALVRNLIEAVEKPLRFGESDITLDASVGFVLGPIHGGTADVLIQNAYLALNEAQRKGRGSFRQFDSAMRDQASDRKQLEQELKAAIPGGQMRLCFQPLVRAQDQSLAGFEALVRWQHPSRGLVSPADFIPAAEESGLILPLGQWVLEEACRAAASWPTHINVAVNISAKQLMLDSFPATLSDLLRKYRLPANRLELEVTETLFLDDTEGSLNVLKRLRPIGVRIALDDFGTGYSSLGYLTKAVFHKLKIDGSFVRDAATNREAVAIIQAIISLANSLRMTIIAEGVETSEDFVRMRDLGCHQIQGYLFGRPMNMESATSLVHGGGLPLSA